MLTQNKINKICQIIENNGEIVTINKVLLLLKNRYSSYEVASKVILYKNNRSKAIDIAKNEIYYKKKSIDGLGSIVRKILFSFSIKESVDISLVIKSKLQEYVDQKIKNKVFKYENTIKKLQNKNNHLETNYYSFKLKFDQLLKNKRFLEDQNYFLQQQLQKLKIDKNNNYFNNKNFFEKPAQVKDYQTQINLLQANCCAAYDIERKNIVVKMPLKHKLEREFKKGSYSIYLHAHATYDEKIRYWFLSRFKANTINFLIRNNFIISKELSYVYHRLRESLFKN